MSVRDLDLTIVDFFYFGSQCKQIFGNLLRYPNKIGTVMW